MKKTVHLISTLLMFLVVSALVLPARAEDTPGTQKGGDAEKQEEKQEQDGVTLVGEIMDVLGPLILDRLLQALFFFQLSLKGLRRSLLSSVGRGGEL